MKKNRTLLEERPSAFLHTLHFSLHLAPKLLQMNDVEPVFMSMRNLKWPLHCLMTFQPVTDSLIEFSEEASECKDHGRDRFCAFMGLVKEAVMEEYQATATAIGEEKEEVGSSSSSGSRDVVVDWSDPATGIPMEGECGPCVYSDADGIEQVLSFELVHICGPGGGCRVISHPRWGSSVYPATGFISAPTDVVVRALARMQTLPPPSETITSEQGGPSSESGSSNNGSIVGRSST